MLSFHAQLKVFVATTPCALRLSFNSLWAAAEQPLGEDPQAGALLVFGNRRHHRLKLLYFDGTGVCVLAKRLEAGTFAWPQSAGVPGAKIRLAPQALQLLLDGAEQWRIHHAGWRSGGKLALLMGCFTPTLVV